MANITSHKKGSITSAIVALLFNLLVMFLLGLFRKKINSKPKRKYVEGEIVK